MHLGRDARERQRQRHPPRGAAAPRALGAGAHRSGGVGARRAAHRVRRPRRARHDPPHDPRARRGGLHPPGRGGPGARRRRTSTTSARRSRPGSRSRTWARPIPAQHDREVGGGTGAGGGAGRGRVTYDAQDPPTGSVLVTTTLSPGLGPLLTRLNGIVAETGSVLSHLAILVPRGRRADRRRLRRTPPGICRRASRSPSTVTPDGSPSRTRRPTDEDHRVARGHRHAARGRGRT